MAPEILIISEERRTCVKIDIPQDVTDEIAGSVRRHVENNLTGDFGDGEKKAKERRIAARLMSKVASALSPKE